MMFINYENGKILGQVMGDIAEVRYKTTQKIYTYVPSFKEPRPWLLCKWVVLMCDQLLDLVRLHEELNEESEWHENQDMGEWVAAVKNRESVIIALINDVNGAYCHSRDFPGSITSQFSGQLNEHAHSVVSNPEWEGWKV